MTKFDVVMIGLCAVGITTVGAVVLYASTFLAIGINSFFHIV